jgi:hypothetical protein
MAGYEEARNPRERKDDAQPIVQPLEAYAADPPAARLPTGVPADDLEDERRVPHWPYVVGALLLLVIPVVVVIILVSVF